MYTLMPYKPLKQRTNSQNIQKMIASRKKQTNSSSLPHLTNDLKTNETIQKNENEQENFFITNNDESFSKQIKKNKKRVNSLGGGISEYLSASVLTHSIVPISFSKAERFPNSKREEIVSNIFRLPTTLKNKTTGFGYGKKTDLFANELKNSSYNPGPKYNCKILNTFQNTLKFRSKNGKFGLKLKNSNFTEKVPGPGSYKVSKLIGIDKPQYSIRTHFKGDDKKRFLSVHELYYPNTELLESKSFGKGGRSKFLDSLNENPGPGMYSVKKKYETKSDNKRKNIEKMKKIIEMRRYNNTVKNQNIFRSFF